MPGMYISNKHDLSVICLLHWLTYAVGCLLNLPMAKWRGCSFCNRRLAIDADGVHLNMLELRYPTSTSNSTCFLNQLPLTAVFQSMTPFSIPLKEADGFSPGISRCIPRADARNYEQKTPRH